jgi:hypothetical protein
MIDKRLLKIGQPVRVLSQKGKCRLIAPIEAVNWQLENVTVHNRMGVKQVIPFNRLKAL